VIDRQQAQVGTRPPWAAPSFRAVARFGFAAFPSTDSRPASVPKRRFQTQPRRAWVTFERILRDQHDGVALWLPAC